MGMNNKKVFNNMLCNKITCSDFRNIKTAEVTFSPGITLLSGDNGEGKTNLLEAVALFALGRSFRGAKDAELLPFKRNTPADGNERPPSEEPARNDSPAGEPAEAGSFTEEPPAESCPVGELPPSPAPPREKSAKTSLALEYADSRRDGRLEIRYSRQSGRVCVKNGVRIPRLSEFIGNFRAVLFCPGHLSIVREGPSARRAFLDAAISQIKPVYLAALQRYNRVLLQRNSLLREMAQKPAAGRDTLELWSAQLAAEAAYIAGERREYVSRLGETVRALVGDMTLGREGAAVEYVSSSDRERGSCEERYLALLTRCTEREIRAGATLYGTHRDDLRLTLNGRDAKAYASQGQQRTVALAMKLAEGELSREAAGEYPVFLLDDIFSELDASRRSYILGGLGSRQVIMTSCERDVAADMVYSVRNGEYTLV